MSMVRLDPFRDLAVLQDRMNRLFNEVPRAGRRDDEVLGTRGSWVPAVDIYEHNGALVMKAELPDLNRDDIDLSVENSTLTLRGERRFDAEVKDDNVHRIERAYGAFSRAFTLPATVDASQISADYKGGVLTIRLPFREEAKPRSIKVDVSA